VLVAEDNPINQRVVERFLERLGCKVVMTDNGVRAVRAYSSEKFDLVLLDLQMPEMDGYTAAREIRAAEPEDSVPIVAVSASVDAATRARCSECGFNEVLQKPVRLSTLAQTLSRCLTSPELLRDSSTRETESPPV
jgi:CheY-like chemotaxis protein